MANPSEEPILPRGRSVISDLEEIIEAQRVALLQKDGLNSELMLEIANLRLTADMESDILVQNERLGAEVESLRQTIDDQSQEIADCKVLKYEAVLDDMEEFCLLYDGAADDDPVKCGWRTAILRMREIRNG